MLKTIALTAILLSTAAQVAGASPAVALVGERTLAVFDTENTEITRRLDVEGVTKLDGIDWQPATGRLIGVASTGEIVAIDLKTGRSETLAEMGTEVPTGETPVIVDVNPATGAIRFMTGTTNHRIDPETGAVTVDGTLAFVDNDANAKTLPTIVAAAYTNSFGQPETTALYGIDSAAGDLVRQTMPTDGALKTIGSLEIEKADSYAFDIETTADGTDKAWLIAGKTLHAVDLETGKATASNDFNGIEERIRDFSVIGPELKSAM